MNGPVDHFIASRDQYVSSPAHDARYCVGNAVECDYLTADGDAQRIPWGGSPEPGELARIRDLHLVPSAFQLRRPVLPAFLADLPNLDALNLPTPLLPLLTRDSVRPGLRMLAINHDHSYPIGSVAFPADVVLPELRALMWITSVNLPTLTQVVSSLPPLEFLYTNLTGDTALLEQIRDRPTLRHLELIDVRNIDIFSYVEAPLRALEIGGTGRDFPIARLSTLRTLKTVRLNGIRADIDCAVFQDLPDLVELTLLNSKRITNVEALLACPTLENLTVVNCANPFKKEGKALFATKGFARLDIRFS